MPIIRDSVEVTLIDPSLWGNDIDAVGEWNEVEDAMTSIMSNGYLCAYGVGSRENGKSLPLVGVNGEYRVAYTDSVSLPGYIAPGMNRFYCQFQIQQTVYAGIKLSIVVGSDEYAIYSKSGIEIQNLYPTTNLGSGLSAVLQTIEVSGRLPSSFRAFTKSKTCYLKIEVDLRDGRNWYNTATQSPFVPGDYIGTTIGGPQIGNDAAVQGVNYAQLWLYKDCSNEC